MKKTMSILFSIVCMIALVGCSGNSPSNSPMTEPPVSIAEPSSIPTESDIQKEVPQQNTPAPPPSTPSSALPESGTQERTPPAEQDAQTEDDAIPTVNIRVGNKNFSLTLYDNDSTWALLEKFPLTLDMGEMNGNEKFYFFSEKLPTNSERVGSIKTGDLMLYGSDCLVLFYESFSTSYSYTRLGYMEDVTGLADALGGGSIQVTFSVGE